MRPRKRFLVQRRRDGDGVWRTVDDRATRRHACARLEAARRAETRRGLDWRVYDGHYQREVRQ